MRDQVLALVERYIGKGYKQAGGSNVVMVCPFEGPDRDRPSNKPFSVNADLGLFNCFSCHISGSLPHLLRMLHVPSDRIALETKGLSAALEENRRLRSQELQRQWYHKDPLEAAVPLSKVVLKPYEWMPLKLVDDGFHPDLLREQSIGFDPLNQRITFPIFDLYGRLAGVMGGRQFDWQEPKYKVYRGRQVDPVTKRVSESDFGPWFAEMYPDYTWQNHDHLWGFNEVYPHLFYSQEVQTVIVVEGFKARLWLLQNGYRNTVAIMGSKLSERQKQLLLRPRAKIILFLDNDLAGQDGMRKSGRDLNLRNDSVWVARYPPHRWECQPDQLRSPGELHKAIAGATRYAEYERSS